MSVYTLVAFGLSGGDQEEMDILAIFDMGCLVR